MTELRMRMDPSTGLGRANDMLVRGMAERTREAYLAAVARLARHYRRSPDRLSPQEVQAYLVHMLREEKLAWSTCNIAVQAFRFLNHATLGRPEPTFTIPAPKQPKTLPEILSPEEVRRVIESTATSGSSPTEGAQPSSRGVERSSRRCHRRRPQDPSRSAELMTKPAATLLVRLTGVDIGQCPVCHAGRLRVVAVFRPGQIPVPRRARGRPQPWTPRESARRVPLAPRVSADPPEARTASPGPRSTLGPPSVHPRSPPVSLLFVATRPFPSPQGSDTIPIEYTRFTRWARLSGRWTMLHRASRTRAHSLVVSSKSRLSLNGEATVKAQDPHSALLCTTECLAATTARNHRRVSGEVESRVPGDRSPGG